MFYFIERLANNFIGTYCTRIKKEVPEGQVNDSTEVRTRVLSGKGTEAWKCLKLVSFSTQHVDTC